MRWPAWILMLSAACGDDDVPVTVKTGDACGGTITTVPTVDSFHVDQGTAITWTSNPPTSGDHFQLWAAWDRAYDDLPRGHWVHNLEHGAVVFGYRCDAGCPDVATQLGDVVRSLPDDPMCVAPVHQRALVVADPLLPTDLTVTAVAWGVFYEGTCVDEGSLQAFFADHVARAPENICANGATLGGTPLF